MIQGHQNLDQPQVDTAKEMELIQIDQELHTKEERTAIHSDRKDLMEREKVHHQTDHILKEKARPQIDQEPLIEKEKKVIRLSQTDHILKEKVRHQTDHMQKEHQVRIDILIKKVMEKELMVPAEHL